MSKTTTFDAWAVVSNSGDVCMDRGVPALYMTRNQAWIRGMSSGLMYVREIPVRVTVETIEEGEA